MAEAPAEEVRFFTGVKFVEPGDNDSRFRNKVQKVFSDSFGKVMKRVSFLILMGRILLNGFMNLRPLVGQGDLSEDHVNRVRTGICNTLISSSDREACAADLQFVASKWDVDVGSQYSVSAQIVYNTERSFFGFNAALLVACLIISSISLYKRPSEPVGYTYLLKARRYANRIAGMSALKSLQFLSVPTLSLYWSTEWLQGIRTCYAEPTEETGLDLNPWVRRFRAITSIAMLVTGLGSLLFAFTAFQVKLLEHQHLIYKEQSEWTWYEWYQFVNLINIIMSIFDLELVCSNRTMLFAFGGKDAKIDVAEWEKKQAYHCRVLKSAKDQFGPLDFLIIAFQHDSSDLQQIMLADDSADDTKGAQGELMSNMKGKPMRALLLGLIGAGIAFGFIIRQYMKVTFEPE